MAKYSKPASILRERPKKSPSMKYAAKRSAPSPIFRRKTQAPAGNEFLVALLIILTVIAVICGLYFVTSGSQFDRAAKKGTLGTSGDDDRQPSASTISIILNTSPYFETGTTPGNIFFENPSHSGKLERLEIYIDDSWELIYKSGYLEPGTYIDYAPLSEDLEAGEYKCTAIIYGYRIDTQEYIGRVAAGITVYVLT